jgi:Rieske Fe-S protein
MFHAGTVQDLHAARQAASAFSSNARRKNPVTLDTMSKCSGCSRRTVLKGLGIAAAGLAFGACMQQGSSLPSATTAACGTNVCIDLANAANTALANVGGALLFDTNNDTIMVIRTSQTTVVALSAICTHSGCSMNYLAAQQLLDCPCHGSQFDLRGSVTRGPARSSLHVYTASLANNTISVVS